MTGIYVTKFTNGVKRMIHLRNVVGISLEKNTTKIQYNFPEIVGEMYKGKFYSHPMFETHTWPSEEVAQTEFEKLQKCLEELK